MNFMEALEVVYKGGKVSVGEGNRKVSMSCPAERLDDFRQNHIKLGINVHWKDIFSKDWRNE